MQRITKNKLDICLIQMCVTKHKDMNIKNAVRLIRQAVLDYNPKIVVLPENWLTLYGLNMYEECAEIIPNGEVYNIMSMLARELRIYLVCGSIPERDDKLKKVFYNTTMVFSPVGDLITKYRKIHLTNIELDTDYHIRETDFVKHGNTLCTFMVGDVKIGLGIGFDLSFVELATLYRKNGCDILIYPACYPVGLGTMHWDTLLRTRAIDNQMFVLGVSVARDDTHDVVCYGHTMVVDPMGRILVRAYDVEEILYCDLDLTLLDKYRDNIKLLTHKRFDLYDTNLLM